MSIFLNTYRKALDFMLSLLVKSNPIPSDPVNELELDRQKCFLYLLPYTSQTDLLILRRHCLQLGLPDPLARNKINGDSLPRFVFLDRGRRFFKSNQLTENTRALFSKYFELHRSHSELDVQLVPVSVLWGRSPGHEKKLPHLRFLGRLQKLWAIAWFGRDNFVRFSKAVSLRDMANLKGSDDDIALKLTRVAKIHFSKQRTSATGPRLPNRQAMFRQILQSSAVQEAIADEAKSKKIDHDKATANAEAMLNEIAANVSHESLRLADRFLRWLWNKLYRGIDVKNGDRVRKLAIEGHEIVYIPCHRSHIDYLLLSYILYHQGLVPPHIAAGINLNFWPVGGRFRRWGAFFIRRTFSGNRLYSTVFRQYLSELFRRGYAVEFFIEGGRSRTGRLLAPKTGMLSMTLQALLEGHTRPISLVPVYIGYEHVLEVDTYAKELRGAAKEKENAGLVLRVIKKLRNMGKGYVNFGEPITLNTYLNQHYPNWKESEGEESKAWLGGAVDKLAVQVMRNINKAAAINAMNLIGTVLLASRQRALAREQLLSQLSIYQQLLNNVAYSRDVIVPQESPQAMLEHVLSLDKVGIIQEKDSFGEIIRLERSSAVLMTYYRNNIQHLFVLPSLIASIVIHHEAIQQSLLIDAVQKIYPFLKSELFLDIDENRLKPWIKQILAELQRQALINLHDEMVGINKRNIRSLQLLSAGIREIIQRYYITLNFLQAEPTISRSNLEKESQSVAQRLSVLHGINAPEFFDKAVFSTFIASLKENGYFTEQGGADSAKVEELAASLKALLSSEVYMTISSSVESAVEKNKPE
ncbi:glycerol-3-phosphate 1-O-acyltransferase [Chelonobacter oris]|uniref:glycerol-3-phosphate 1-O-acyltransferase PlsB n=1 Tax=Chelonobacter oris TaxID=505317 RepID=UPI00244D4445|nr:glycerol-3-phosphate 1-O-acyltransferase PlsB [Chelonobacter oris]MDH3000914.1 glycerol-3-phosphate 1-O-acyltransferase [Chelonobacter oris]